MNRDPSVGLLFALVLVLVHLVGLAHIDLDAAAISGDKTAVAIVADRGPKLVGGAGGAGRHRALHEP
jgi:hypothetical protein